MDVKIKQMERYMEPYKRLLFNSVNYKKLMETQTMWRHCQQRGGKVIFLGNGGSAAMASHCAVDLTKIGGIRAVCFNEADLITCFSNDYGYDQWMRKAIEFYADSKDVIVLISSSGNSDNILIAARTAAQMQIPIVTFSGFDARNLLRNLGKINLWVDSKTYNIVEMVHHIWLTAIIDLL